MSLIPNRPQLFHTLEAVGLDPAQRLGTRATLAEIDFAGIARQAQSARADAVRGFFGGIGRWLGRHIVAPLRAARERRRAIAELSRMDDYALHDMGLTRSGILSAVDAADDIRHAPANENAPSRRPSRAA